MNDVTREEAMRAVNYAKTVLNEFTDLRKCALEIQEAQDEFMKYIEHIGLDN